MNPKSSLSEQQKQSSIPNAATNKEESRAQGRHDEESDVIGATSGIPVIGIGGSAGALESFKNFFVAMPADSGAAFVVIQHLAPSHPSLLTEILAQHTCMQVCEAQEEMPVAPNCVYIIPPNHYLGIRDGVLYLAEPVTEHGIRMPINFFFRDLAEDRQERAICILFSGAGSDGTLGVRAVRGAGGLTIAQDQTAQFGEMPRSAMATGLVDLVLPPDQMPKAIVDYLQQPYIRGGEPAAVLEAEGKADGFNEILYLVRVQTGCDFQCYKKSTILRRIERRMGLRHIADISRYSALLRQDPGEVDQLRLDLLINVTAFFRDAESFEELRRIVISPLVREIMTDDTLRVWVPGCSSGEEAYSVAMLLLEEVEAARKHCGVQIFATDIDDEALQFARTGVYPESIVADVGVDRIARFFFRKDGCYHVSELLRGSVVFAAQNLISDPPFSKMDLISCRNLLIYLDAAVQATLIPLFNFALKPGGYLFLGKSEGVGGQHELFDTISKMVRIYRRLTPARQVTLDSPIRSGARKTMPTVSPTEHKPSPASYADSIRNALLNHFTASVVLVSRKGQVLQFHGQTGKYLNMPTGEPSLNLLEIAKEGLSLKLRSALRQAAGEGKTVVMDNIRIAQSDGDSFARVTVVPIAQRADAEPLLAVIFEDVSRPLKIEPEPARGENETLIRQLENELRDMRQDLQASVGDLQASNEELRVANEEVTSSNEELQSTNEELETSKEELQSVNEELTTINSQLQDKVGQLNTANRDITNFQASTQIATLFLDSEQRIKLFTPATTRLLKLIPSDTGRPISDLSMPFIDYDLPADARAVIREENVIEREVRHTDGSSYLVRVMPYLTPGNQVDGVTVTFSDVTSLRRADAQIRRLATVVTDSNDAVILFDMEGNVQAWNRGARDMYGWSETEALGKNFLDFMPADNAEEHLDLIRRLRTGESTASFETQRLTKDGRRLDVWLTITAVLDESQNVLSFASTERDITERKRQGTAILRAKKEWERTFDSVPDLIAILDDQHRIVRVNRAMAERLGVTLEQCVGLHCYKAVHGADAPPDFCPHARTLLEGGEHATEVHEDRLGGDFLVTTTPMLSPEGRMEGTIHVAREITERKLAERERETVVEFLHLVNEAKGTADLVSTAAGFFHARSGCEAVGIRLREGDDYPYYEARGFPREFVRMENSLCARDVEGLPILSSSGNPIMECMCGNVIQGRFDASKPFFTLRGSFWTNCTTELLAGTTDADRQANTRNRCNGQGYESVALIALRVGEERLGLLQLNDKRRNRFTPTIIALWERLSDYLAVALAKTRAEEALYNLNVDLEQRVQERTMQLRALAVELAQTEERERKRLAQVLHDHLQQLLVAAKFSASILRNKVADVIQPEVQNVLDLLGQSIDASRSLTVELSPPILHDGGLAAGLTWLAHWMQEKHGIAVEVNSQTLPTPLSEDLRLMCFQAVRELLLNIVKHAGVTSAQITMTHDQGRSLHIVVSDKGKGFDPAQSNTVASGSFGLFSIRERFALLGGRLDVESSPDQGTLAILTVPLPHSALLQPKESASQLAGKPLSPISASGVIRILVADDHALFRKGLVELLQKETGFAVVGEAANGRHALERARQLRPDVVLMDVTMPQMNGIDATRLLLNEMPGVRVIGLSMHANEMAAMMQAAGAIHYFVKDGRIEDLIAAIREVCPRQDSEP